MLEPLAAKARPVIITFFRRSDKIKFLQNRETRDAMCSDGFRLKADLVKQ